MAFSESLEEVWCWKERVAQETKNLSAEEQIVYFQRSRKEFLNKSDLPLDKPACENTSTIENGNLE
jgi:hypothetical protein